MDAVGAAPGHRKGLMPSVLPGSESRARAQRGSPGTQEILPFPRKRSRPGLPGDQPRAHRRHTRRGWERKSRVPVVPPSEGNEVRREERQEVIAP